MATPETRRQLLAAVQACEDKKGEDTRILELDPADSGLADFFLITSATNDRQVVAIADEIEFRLKRDFGLYAASVEGRRQAEWILLDYIDIVIHVFLAEKRAFYDIERLRKSARPLTPAEVDAEVDRDLKSALAEKTRVVRSSRSKETPSSTKPKGDSKPVTARKAVKKATKTAAKKAVKKTAKPAAKPTPKKAVAKAVKAKPAARKATPKPAVRAAAKAAKKAARKTTPAKTGAFSPPKESLGAKPPVVKSDGPERLGALAPTDISEGAKPPVVRVEAPESLDLTASAAPAKKKPAKKSPGN